jgi:peptide/nickel transport system permease protein
MAIYEKVYHLNDPLYVQYFYYIYGLLHLQLGFSPTREEPVLTVISLALPYTLQLIMLSMIFTGIMGIAGGLISAKYVGRALEKIIKTTYIASTSAPPFLMPLVLLLIFATLIPVLPTSGPIASNLNLPTTITGIPMFDAAIEGNWPAFLSLFEHALLPSLAIALSLYGFLTRVISSSIVEILDSNFVRAARARGVSENSVLFRYGLKNSMIAAITILSLILTFILVNDVFVESIFSYPGLGSYAVEAIQSYDYPGILGTTLVYAVIITTTNLVADLLYFLADPRVRHEW